MSTSVHSALYLSVPFCRTKCSFCNFASGVHSRELLDRYVAYLAESIAGAPQLAASFGAAFDPILDSIYLGGGTPSILSPAQLDRFFAAISRTFSPSPSAEITVEVAPGTLSDEVLDALVHAGVNRVSLGVQSFVDQESRSVGRLHTCEIARADVVRLRSAGITEISIDLIAGLPYQTPESWEHSLDQLISLAVSHASVYMLEIDEDSRLGRELIAGGARYHAHHVPDEELTVALYERACQRLNDAGIAQYEISNFARPGHQSRHNLRYWQRLPYFGFGVDAHSMFSCAPHSVQSWRPSNSGVPPENPVRGCPIPAPPSGLSGPSSHPHRAIRLAYTDSLDQLLAGVPPEITIVNERQAIEETYFLGLRMNRGVSLLGIKEEFGIDAVDVYRESIADLVSRELLVIEEGWLRLTPRGRLLSNEVFAAFLRD